MPEVEVGAVVESIERNWARGYRAGRVNAVLVMVSSSIGGVLALVALWMVLAGALTVSKMMQPLALGACLIGVVSATTGVREGILLRHSWKEQWQQEQRVIAQLKATVHETESGE